mmetsp:Transcript_33752/g.100230  ORF Transcript_33752/g.100230 Transcript_33752/m.100230 type:complete len:207 (-) Transcript_33752:18-638(-)
MTFSESPAPPSACTICSLPPPASFSAIFWRITSARFNPPLPPLPPRKRFSARSSSSFAPGITTKPSSSTSTSRASSSMSSSGPVPTDWPSSRKASTAASSSSFCFLEISKTFLVMLAGSILALSSSSSSSFLRSFWRGFFLSPRLSSCSMMSSDRGLCRSASVDLPPFCFGIASAPGGAADSRTDAVLPLGAGRARGRLRKRPRCP